MQTLTKPILYDGNTPIEYDAIKYSWISANEEGIKEHPQKDVQRLGMKVYKYVALGVADCSIMLVDKVPDTLPKYISILALDNEMIKYLGLEL